MIAAITDVHTVGINWVSVATTIGIIVAILSTVCAFLAKYIAGQVTSSINSFRIQVIEQLDRRLSRLEMIVEFIMPNGQVKHRKDGEHYDTDNAG
jgi:hypothetical protein